MAWEETSHKRCSAMGGRLIRITDTLNSGCVRRFPAGCHGQACSFYAVLQGMMKKDIVDSHWRVWGTYCKFTILKRFKYAHAQHLSSKCASGFLQTGRGNAWLLWYFLMHANILKVSVVNAAPGGAKNSKLYIHIYTSPYHHHVHTFTKQQTPVELLVLHLRVFPGKSSRSIKTHLSWCDTQPQLATAHILGLSSLRRLCSRLSL